MQRIFENIGAAVLTLRNTIEWNDILDIALMSILIYGLITIVRRTRAVQLVKGIAMLFIGYLLASMLQLKTITFLFDNVFQVGLVALVVVFQPELRRALERMGRGKIGAMLSFLGSRPTPEKTLIWKDAIATICDSAEHMSASRTGALMVIERSTGLGEIINTGTSVDAEATSELIETIFYEGSPLHDGAVVIRDGRVCAAGCLLPLTSNSDISRDMGTRHRAAIGMSESSDAIVVVVSEETGIISVAKNGLVVRRLDRASLHQILENEIIPAPQEKPEILSVLKKGDKNEK